MDRKDRSNFIDRVLRVFAFGSGDGMDASDELSWRAEVDGDLHFYAVVSTYAPLYEQNGEDINTYHHITEENLSILERAHAEILSEGKIYGISNRFALLLEHESHTL